MLKKRKTPLSNEEKCALDHILEAQERGEINEDNVLYIIENINVAGNYILSECRFWSANQDE